MIFISRNLERLRKKAGLKQAELADKLGVKANTISNYEKGVSQPDYLIISKLMKLFEVTSDELLFCDISEISTSRSLTKEEVTESVFDKFLSKINERDKKLDEKDTLLKDKEAKIDQLQSELRSMGEELATLKAYHSQSSSQSDDIALAFPSDSSGGSIKDSIHTRKPTAILGKSSAGKT